MAQNIQPFLMFQRDDAEEAMNFYVGLFPDGKVLHIERHGADGPGKEGTVVQATFVINGQTVMCIDSPIKHAFEFTPSFSFFVNCSSEDELKKLFEALSRGGETLMPLDSYDFSRLFSWIKDRFGVSWQLNLP